MLSPWWWLPLAVAGATTCALWRASRAMLEEAARLDASSAELRQVRRVVEQVSAQVAAVRAGPRDMHDLGHR